MFTGTVLSLRFLWGSGWVFSCTWKWLLLPLKVLGKAEGSTKSSTLAYGHVLLAWHRVGFLFLFIFILSCFNGVQEHIELSQEKGRKRKRKGPRVLQRRRVKIKRAKRGQGSLGGRTRERRQGGKGCSRLHGLTAAGRLPRQSAG